LTCLFEKLRTEETNIGNFFADLLATEYEADFGMMTGGAIRLNEVIKKGSIKFLDIQSMLPFPDTVCVVEITGDTMHKVLENAVSKWPIHDGRFAHVSGLKFSFDPRKPTLSRINIEDVIVMSTGEKIDPEKKYTLSVPSYAGLGHDGYDVLKRENGNVRDVFEFHNTLNVIDIVRLFLRRT